MCGKTTGCGSKQTKCKKTSVYMKQFSIPLLNYLLFFMFVLLAGKHIYLAYIWQDTS